MAEPSRFPERLHVLGASGSGTTTFGRAWAARHGVVHLDTDDYYWEPTDPPFRRKRPVETRLAMLERALDAAGRWVLTGSMTSWGDRLARRFDMVVFVLTPHEVRLDRLIAREIERYGEEALQPGGARHDDYVAFIDWAASYDTAGFGMRSRRQHEAWLEALPCPVVRVSGLDSTEEQVLQVEREWAARGG